MTYQTTTTQTHDDDAKVKDVPAKTTKTNGVPTMRAMIATCVLLGTLAVLYGGSGSSNRHTNSSSTTANLGVIYPRGYDPTKDYCFQDNDTDHTYCWFPIDRFPDGNWEGVAAGRGYNDCGPRCKWVFDSQTDFCFRNKDNNRYCWEPFDSISIAPWTRVTGVADNTCGKMCR